MPSKNDSNFFEKTSSKLGGRVRGQRRKKTKLTVISLLSIFLIPGFIILSAGAYLIHAGVPGTCAISNALPFLGTTTTFSPSSFQDLPSVGLRDSGLPRDALTGKNVDENLIQGNTTTTSTTVTTTTITSTTSTTTTSTSTSSTTTTIPCGGLGEQPCEGEQEQPCDEGLTVSSNDTCVPIECGETVNSGRGGCGSFALNWCTPKAKNY